MEEPLTPSSELLEELARIQRKTKLDVRGESWRYLAVWSVVFLGAFFSSFLSDLAGWYWVIGVPLGYLGMYLAYRNVNDDRVGAKSWPYAVTGIGIGIVNMVASFVLPDEAIVVAVWVVLGVGFAVLSWIDRQPLAAALFAALSLLALLLGLTTEDTFQLYPVLAMIFTLITAATSFGLWLWARRS
ncbi:MAG: hypothetical protein ACR2NT_04640 [Acidimicrobiia bacterium]|nr:hypothetical protein [Acidimicrobiia bacterium]MDQ3500660.1 hypothetical protein [Actinomycetota bacterium]